MNNISNVESYCGEINSKPSVENGKKPSSDSRNLNIFDQGGGLDEEWMKGKEAMRVLGDTIANIYNEKYASSNFSTGLYMSFEAEVLREAIDLIPKHERTIALDIGCGTGKYTFILREYFSQSIGFDFSKGMIDKALKTKFRNGYGGVSFELRDIEERGLDRIPDNHIALACASFGMGSYVLEIHRFLRELRRILKPGGILMISFYNSNSLIERLKDHLEWAPSLTAKCDSKSKKVQVDFDGIEKYISARAYTYDEIEQMLRGNFHVEKILTYPTLSSLLPNKFFESNDGKEIFRIVDGILAENEIIAGGPYILAICRKIGELRERPESIGFERIMEMFKMHNIRYNPKEHAPSVSIDEIELALKTSRTNIAKVDVFVREWNGEIEQESDSKEFLNRCKKIKSKESKKQSMERGKEKKFYALVFTADREVHLEKFLKFIGAKKKKVRMAYQQELEDIMGFEKENLPPFGFPKYVVIILDRSLFRHEAIWCSVGKRTEHILLKLDDLKALTSCNTIEKAITKPNLEWELKCCGIPRSRVKSSQSAAA